MQGSDSVSVLSRKPNIKLSLFTEGPKIYRKEVIHINSQDSSA